MSELNSSLCQLNWLIAKNGTKPEPNSINVSNHAPNISKNDESSSSGLKMKTSKRKTFKDGEKPPFSYSQLIKMAIENSPFQRCTLSGIYQYISENFEFYKENRSSSWRNSIRHNLSLNKQFKRQDKEDGSKAGFWICVDPPPKVQRVLRGTPPRLNPLIERMLQKHKIDKSSSNNTTEPSSSQQLPDLNEQEIRDMKLFESYDLNSSFRDVYDQIFEEEKSVDAQQEVARINWLQISLEAAGLDYKDEQEMKNLDTEKFKNHYFQKQNAPTITQFQPDPTNAAPQLSSGPLKPTGEESDEEFDWNTIL